MMDSTKDLTLALEPNVQLENTVVVSSLKPELLPGTVGPGWQCEGPGGDSGPAQISRLSNGETLVGVYVSEHDAGAAAELTLRKGEVEEGRGIDVVDQPENGRLVIKYSGFMQTIYHYGRELFKPRFYPITVPCARGGDMEGDDTVYPKSITDDSPPDHIWHRSLWYACGELNDVDFYLENGGEGRMVHQEFTDIFSGPLFGGFRERLLWVAPDGREMLRDERSAIFYRVRGRVRVFDLGASFTAMDEPVTFGRTNENALPLIRVTDIIDEWDGGRITLADGTTGAKDSFSKRSPWADCSGPLVRLPGKEPEWYGIAMLDHPSNRNHPSAWFARSYGPLGTNLPFFDGPLTLQPGETWELRHRIVVHQGDPWEAGIPQRYDEYADPPALSLAQ